MTNSKTLGQKGDPNGIERDEETLDSRQEFLQIFKRGAEFTEELMKENERLRYRVAAMESVPPDADDDTALINQLIQKVSRLEQEREEMVRRYSEVEAENKDFASRYVEIENENNNLLNIYVASYQLHSTLEFQEVLRIITEIVLNFVGAEVFAICTLQEGGRELRVLTSEGIDRQELGALSIDAGVIGKVIETGEPYFLEEIPEGPIVPKEPPICVPLAIKDERIGVIVIYRFLQQKKKLAAVDHELFTLLAGHAATAIFASKLYTDSKRKLNTIQGFIDLMSSSEDAAR
ncbi:MAG: GAF domain-containing protein [Myxococcota bacterium]